MKSYRYVTLAFAIIAMLSSTALAGGLTKPVSAVPEAQKLIDQAWKLYKSESSAPIYKQCITLMEQAEKLDPKNDTILTDISRYYWSYGDNLPKATKEQQKELERLYGEGVKAAQRSLAVKETVGGHYWLAVNKAAGLEFSSIPVQVAGFPVIYKHSQYVQKNGDDYFYGGDGRLWSEIVSRVPKKAIELVGYDVKLVLEGIDKSIKIEPRYLDNYLFKARFLHVYYGKDAEALALLDTLLKQDPAALPDEVADNRAAQNNAKLLWKELTGKEYPQK